MDVVKIDGNSFDVLVKELSENFTILYSENTGRTMSIGARMSLDPLGTFYGHKVTFSRKRGKELEYDRLFDYLSTPRYDGMFFEIVGHDGSMGYEGYVSQGERKLKRIDPDTGKIYWDEFSVNIVPMEAYEVPV